MQKKTSTKSSASTSKSPTGKNIKVVATRTPVVAKPLNEEQKDAVRAIYDYPITVLYGASGSGKSYTAVHAALKLHKERRVEKIILARPAVSTEEIGFLPGTIEDKVEVPYLAPIIDFINSSTSNKNLYETMKAKGEIEFIPLALMRGRSFNNAVIIVDEIQNATPHQVKMVITRIGQDSKMIFTGDSDQCDLSRYKVPVNGMDALLRLSNHVSHIKEVLLIECVRNPIITDILTGWEKIDLVNRP